MYRKWQAAWAAARQPRKTKGKTGKLTTPTRRKTCCAGSAPILLHGYCGRFASDNGGPPADCRDELQRVVNPDLIAEAAFRASKAESVMLSQTFHYSVASVVSAAIGLLSAVVFTRLLSPQEYGVYVVGLSTAGIVSALLFTWVRVAALRFQSEGGAVDVRKTIFVAYLISALAAPVALLIATLTTSVSLERNLAAIFFALGLGLFELGQELLKARLQSFTFMTASIIRACLAFTLCLAAALLGGGGLCQLAMVAVTYFVTTMLFAGTILRSPVAGPKISDLRTFAGFGIPITLSGIVFALHAALDRMLVFHFLGDHAAGQYGASADLVRQIILIPAVSIASATVPLAVRAYATGGAGEARPHLEFSLEILLAAVLPAVAGVALTSNYIAGVILGSEFRETAATIMPILAFAWLFQSISQSYIHASFHLAKTPFMMTTQSIAMLIANLLVMPVLLARFGLVGAASSLVIVEACGAAFGWYLTRKAFPLPFNAFQVLRIVAATAIMALVLTFLKPLLPIGVVSFGVLAVTGCVVYLAAAFAFDIAGLRKAAIAYGARRNLPTPSTGIPSMSARES
jgi:O-antigen/teichoic acid export membrane protein